MRKFASCVAGVTLIEYALIAALIAVALVAVLAATGDSLNATFSAISSSV